MGGAAVPLDFAVQPPAVVLLAGLQGAGKTTTAAKLGHLLRSQKKNVLLVSADVYRPAAIEQLAMLAGQVVDVDVFPSTVGEQPVAIAEAALDYAKKHLRDVLFVDTAGRLAIDEAMMAELRELHAAALKPIETLFIMERHARPGRGEYRQGIRRCVAAHRCRCWQELRQRCPWRRSTLRAPRHRRAAQVRPVSARNWTQASRSSTPSASPRASSAWATSPSLIEEAHRLGRRGRGEEVCEEGEDRQGLRPRRLQGADRSDAQDGRLRPCWKAAGRAAAQGQIATLSERKVGASKASSIR